MATIFMHPTPSIRRRVFLQRGSLARRAERLGSPLYTASDEQTLEDAISHARAALLLA